jgi:hypothetical protein
MPANFKDQIFARSVIDAMDSPPPLVGLNARVHMLRIYSGYYETMYVGVIDRYSFFLKPKRTEVLVACSVECLWLAGFDATFGLRDDDVWEAKW